MVMTAVLQEGHPWVWLALLFASAGVFHHAGIKIPFFAFFAHDAGIRTREPPRNMLIAMLLAAALCVFNGAYPWILYGSLPYQVDYTPYDATHVIAQLQLLFFSALAFTWLKLTGLYPPELRSVNLDAEWLYRRLVPQTIRGLGDAIIPASRTLRERIQMQLTSFFHTTHRYFGPQSVSARTWPSGRMVLWVAALLGGYLLFYYF